MAGSDRTTPRRLRPRPRKLLLTAHVTASVGLLGADSAVLLLAVEGARGADPAAVYPAAQLIGALLLVPLALAALLTGTVQGLLTPWGLLRYWWVALKLALTSAGAVLALVVLTPALAGLADAAGRGGAIPAAQRLLLVRDSGAACVVLLVTVALSVHKPFGRLIRRRIRPTW
ncbi:MAG: hypothetical protein ACXVX8_17640 [Blastococcus sp.]